MRNYLISFTSIIGPLPRFDAEFERLGLEGDGSQGSRDADFSFLHYSSAMFLAVSEKDFQNIMQLVGSISLKSVSLILMPSSRREELLFLLHSAEARTAQAVLVGQLRPRSDYQGSFSAVSTTPFRGVGIADIFCASVCSRIRNAAVSSLSMIRKPTTSCS